MLLGLQEVHDSGAWHLQLQEPSLPASQARLNPSHWQPITRQVSCTAALQRAVLARSQHLCITSPTCRLSGLLSQPLPVAQLLPPDALLCRASFVWTHRCSTSNSLQGGRLHSPTLHRTPSLAQTRSSSQRQALEVLDTRMSPPGHGRLPRQLRPSLQTVGLARTGGMPRSAPQPPQLPPPGPLLGHQAPKDSSTSTSSSSSGRRMAGLQLSLPGQGVGVRRRGRGRRPRWWLPPSRKWSSRSTSLCGSWLCS